MPNEGSAFNSCKPWAPQIEELRELAAQGHTVNHMAKTLGRSVLAIECKLESMGLKHLHQPYQPPKQKIEPKAEPEPEKPMSQSNPNKVNIQIFIGEKKAKNMSNEEIIKIVEEEERFIGKIGILKAISPATKKMVKAKERNIAALMALLVEEEEEHAELIDALLDKG